MLVIYPEMGQKEPKKVKKDKNYPKRVTLFVKILPLDFFFFLEIRMIDMLGVTKRFCHLIADLHRGGTCLSN